MSWWSLIIYDVIPYKNMQSLEKSKHEGPSLNITIMGHNNEVDNSYEFRPQWRVGLGAGLGVGHSYKFIRIVQLVKYIQFEFVRIIHLVKYVRIAVRSGWA